MGKGETYEQFVEKFTPKKTTDDCYTPPIVYNAVAEFVANRYGINKDSFVRPFYPGGDFERYEYNPSDIVVDNPPFSIITRIVRFYTKHDIKFFLFAPSLTLFSGNYDCCMIPAGVGITYENGAVVSTSFVTNLEPDDVLIRVIPELRAIVEAADKESTAQDKVALPKYAYPDNVVTAAMCQYLAAHDTPLTICRGEASFTRALDAQKERGKAIFGGGYLLSSKAAAEKAAAEKAAAEKAAAIRWKLSERELDVIRKLDEDA